MRMGRRAKLVAVAVAVVVAGGVNVAAARLDAHSGDARRTAAEHDVRAWLAKEHVRGTVDCRSGRSCAVTLPGGRVVAVDPLAMSLSTN
jgi:hypothetical protein